MKDETRVENLIVKDLARYWVIISIAVGTTLTLAGGIYVVDSSLNSRIQRIESDTQKHTDEDVKTEDRVRALEVFEAERSVQNAKRDVLLCFLLVKGDASKCNTL